MPVNSLLFNCYKHEKTSLRESGIEVSLDRRTDELVLMFVTDNAEFRRALKIERSSDVLFVYRRLGQEHAYHLFFIELKSGSAEKGVEQLQQTIGAVRTQVLQKLRDVDCELRACVVTKHSAPVNIRKQQKEFIKKVGATLQSTHVAGGKPTSLRDVFPGDFPKSR